MRAVLQPSGALPHPAMLTGPTASRGQRRAAPPSDRHLEAQQPGRRAPGTAPGAPPLPDHLAAKLFFAPYTTQKWPQRDSAKCAVIHLCTGVRHLHVPLMNSILCIHAQRLCISRVSPLKIARGAVLPPGGEAAEGAATPRSTRP